MSLVLAYGVLNINILYKNEYLTIGMVVWVGMERVITFSDFNPFLTGNMNTVHFQQSRPR